MAFRRHSFTLWCGNTSSLSSIKDLALYIKFLFILHALRQQAPQQSLSIEDAKLWQILAAKQKASLASKKPHFSALAIS